MTEIESFEPYHIGIKIRPAFDPASIRKFREILGIKESYEVIPESPYLGIPIIEVAKKETTIIQLNIEGNAVNSIGSNPNEVIEVSKEILDFLSESGFDMDSSVSFYEIIAAISIKTDKNPLETLTSNVKFETSQFNEFDASITGYKISSTDIKDENELFEMLIEPKAVSPKSRYFVKIFMRTRDFEKIIEFNERIEEFVNNTIHILEEAI